jgi:hypothetical protein
MNTQPPMVSDDLRRQADQFIDLADLEEQICRPNSEHFPGESGGRNAPDRSYSDAESDDFADA